MCNKERVQEEGVQDRGREGEERRRGEEKEEEK